MDYEEAYETYNEAISEWESGDRDSFYDSAADLNAWMQDNDFGPFMPEDWYPDDLRMQNEMWEWIDTLSHEEREEFFGY